MLLKSIQLSTNRIVGNTFVLIPTAYGEIYHGLIVSLDSTQYPVLTITCAWYPASSHHHYSPNPDMGSLSAGLVSWAPNWPASTRHLSPVLRLPPDSKNELSHIPVVMPPSFGSLPSHQGWHVNSLDRLWAFSCSDSVYLSHHIFSLFSSYTFYFFSLENGIEEQILLIFKYLHQVPHSVLWSLLCLTQWDLNVPTFPITDNPNVIICLHSFLLVGHGAV